MHAAGRAKTLVSAFSASAAAGSASACRSTFQSVIEETLELLAAIAAAGMSLEKPSKPVTLQ